MNGGALDIAPDSMETCIYVIEATPAARVLLIRPTAGGNAGKWVPLGSRVKKSSSPHFQAKQDLAFLAESVAEPELCGLVTEVGDAGWRNTLVLYRVALRVLAAKVSVLVPHEHRWWPPADIRGLQKPQADSYFPEYTYRLGDKVFEADAMFARDGSLRSFEMYEMDS